MLRKKLATVAHIKDFRDDILAKLMILEYAEPKLFEILYNWQISNQGIATQLEKLEEICCKKSDVQLAFTDDLKEWNKPKIVNWMSSEPLLSKIDLRDYYWISRDKLSSMQSNLLVPPVVKSLMAKLEPDGMAEKLTTKILNKELKVLNGNYQSAFFSLLKQRIITEPDKNRYYDLFNVALREGFDCKSIYVEALTSVRRKLPPAVIESLKQFTGTHAEFNQFVGNKQKGKI